MDNRTYSEPLDLAGQAAFIVSMKMENIIRVLAGSLVLLSLALSVWVNRWWLLLALFVALNLIQSAFTGFCLAERILRRLGLGAEEACPGREVRAS
jgi:hypothetical protein